MPNEYIGFLLFILGLITGFIGTNTGGSALVTVPIMICLDISPKSAIANARVASIGAMIGGLRQFYKHGKIDFCLASKTSFLSVIGACIGAYLIIHIPFIYCRKGNKHYNAFLVIAIDKQKKTILNILHRNQRIYLEELLGYSLFIFAGMLGGFFGGQAIITTYIFSIFFNKTISESIGTRKINGLLVSFSSLLIYDVHNLINWFFSIALVLGTLIGSTLGATYALKKGEQWTENLFNIVVVIISLHMLVN